MTRCKIGILASERIDKKEHLGKYFWRFLVENNKIEIINDARKREKQQVLTIVCICEML